MTPCRNHSSHMPDCPYCVVASVDTEYIEKLRGEIARLQAALVAKDTEISRLREALDWVEEQDRQREPTLMERFDHVNNLLRLRALGQSDDQEGAGT
jgi:hypothetical protein